MLSAFIDVLGWSLIHSLWQSALLFVVLKLLLHLLKKGPARLRYLLAALGMAGVFISFLFTFYTLWQPVQVSRAMTDTAVAAQTSATTASTLLMQGAATAPAGSGFLQDGLFYLVLFYAAGLLFFIGKSLRDAMVMQQIRHNRIQPFDPAWDRHLQKLAATWNITRKVGLYLSEKVDVPAVIGYLKPVIYLPVSIANHLTSEQIEAILLHELAHVKRGDFIINLLQNIVEALLFFNPFVWWLSRTMSRERELACDEMVLSEKEPELYAQSLLALAENQVHQGRFVLAAAGKKQQLLHRIKKMTTMKTQKLNALQKTMVLLSMVVALFSISWLVPEKQMPQPADPSSAKLQTSYVTFHQDSIPPDPGTQHAGTAGSGATITLKAPPAADAPSPPEAPQPPSRPAAVSPALPAPPAAGTVAATSLPASRSVQFNQVGKGSARTITFTDSLPPDSFTFNMDSMGNSIKSYFNSDEWKSNMQGIRDMSAKMRAQMNSEDWQAYKDSLHTYVSKVQQYFKSDEWKDQMAGLKDKLRQIRQEVHSGTPPEQNKTTWFVHQLQADGLLDTDADYKVRLDNRGLYINGRKQPDTDYQKYRKMFPDAKIKIKKDGGSYSSTFSSNHEDH